MRSSRGTTEFVRLSDIHTNPRVNREMDENWVARLIRDWDPLAVGVPIVARENGHFMVLDGQHRLEAIRQMSPDDPRVEVQVLDDLTESGQARIFVEGNTRRSVPAFEKFAKRIVADDPDASAIAAIIKRHGLILKNAPQARCVGAVVALETVFNYDKTGAILGTTLGILTAAFEADYTSFHNDIIKGVGGFIRRFPEADTKRLAGVLAKTASGASGLLGKGRTMREVNGGSVAAGVAVAVLALYNRGLQNKLGVESS